MDAGNVIGEAAERHPNGKIRWVCECICGKMTTTTSHNLQSGDTKSCGCLKREVQSKPYGVAARNRVKKAYLQNAKKRNLPWNLSDEQFAILLAQNCFYCGIRPSTKVVDTAYHFLYNGIDRLDPKNGYNWENVVPCCSRCNWAKSDMTSLEFYTWLRRVFACHFATKRAYS